MSLQQAFDLYLPLIELELDELVQAATRLILTGRADEVSQGLTTYFAMMRYHLGWTDEALRPAQTPGGKRLRPLLCLLSCAAAGGDPRQALPAACAVELVHNFSLIHDDIQDRSPMRRGRRAVWDVWGVPQAINVGDGMFVVARLALHDLADQGVPLDRCQAAVQSLDRACLALCEGQFLDMTFEGRLDVAMDEYVKMIGHKTAALMSASTQLGAIVATGDESLVELYGRFGENLGIAFQIQDDILGIWGEEEVTGKSAATDLRDRKKTLPVVYAMEHSDRAAAREMAELYGQPGPLGESAIEACMALLRRLRAREYADELSERYYRLALEVLDKTRPQSMAQAQLRELASSLRGRKA